MSPSVRSVVCLISLSLTVTLSLADNDHGSEAVSYSKDTFQNAINEKKHFVMFFAPWCGHCKRLAPTWDSLAKNFNNDESDVTIAKVDCTIETSLCAEHDVTGYPTLKFFHKKPDKFQRYKGNRDIDSLQKFVEEQASQVSTQSGVQIDGMPTPFPRHSSEMTDEHGEYPPVPSKEEDKKQAVVSLTSDTFVEGVLQGYNFVKFYAPWCGHCKKLAPTWEDLAKSFAGSEHVTISMVDCTVSSDLCKDEGIRGYPTLVLFKDGHPIEQYRGSRTHEELKSFVLEKVKETSGMDFGGEQETVPEKEEGVADLTTASFDEVIHDGLTFVKFYAPWCGHCKHLAPTWVDLAKAFASKDVTIARVNCDASESESVCSRYSISGYPTLVMFQNGVRLEDYQKQRDLASLKEYVTGFLEHTEL